MSKGRNMQADHPGDLLFTLQGQHQSGLLSVERNQNGRLEEGEVYLLAGQLIYAHTGKLGGLEALKYLLTWRAIHFSFITDAPRPPANLPARITLQNSSTLPSPHTTGRLGPLPQLPAPAQPGPSTRTTRQFPRRTTQEPYLPPFPLTHRQRVIYLLVNGQRSLEDLARCCGRSPAEVELILRELQQMGLIII